MSLIYIEVSRLQIGMKYILHTLLCAILDACDCLPRECYWFLDILRPSTQ